jgi:hypothetical protein
MTPNSSVNQKTSAMNRGVARQALDLGEARAGEHVPVPDDLVDDVGLGGVERLGRVADVLRRVEDAVGQRAVELAQRDEPRRAVVLEAGQRAQAGGDLAELRDVVLRQPEAGLALEVLAAGVLLVLVVQLAAHDAPDLVLGLGVVDARDRLAGRPGHRRRRDLVAALAVLGVVEPRVVLAEVDLDLAVLALGDRRVQLGFLEHRSAPQVVRSATRAPRRATTGKSARPDRSGRPTSPRPRQ